MEFEIEGTRDGEEERECVEITTTDPCSFYVTRVPESVFSVNPEETLRVRLGEIERGYVGTTKLDVIFLPIFISQSLRQCFVCTVRTYALTTSEVLAECEWSTPHQSKLSWRGLISTTTSFRAPVYV